MTYSLDLKQLLDSLPYQKIILWGTSYGTRLALASAEHNKVHRLLLDSPYPFEYGGFSDETKLLVKVPALHRIHFEKFGPEGVRYSELFLLAYERLKKQPIHAQITRWDGEPELDFVLNTDRLLALEFDALYDESLLGLYYSGLASIVDEPDALSDDLRRVLESMVTNAYTPTFSSMAYIATECNDNGMESRIEVEKALAHLDGHRFYGDYLDYFNMDLCRNKLFEQTRRINTLSYDAIQDTPTLILSGEQDPVTPEYWGRALHTKIDSAYWAGIEGLGHAVLASYLCDWSQLEVFLEKGVMNRLDCATEWLQARAVQNLVPEQN